MPFSGKIPVKPSLAERTTTSTHASMVSPPHFCFICTLESDYVSVLSALIDSSTAGDFMDHNTIVKIDIHT